jgi:superfamily I DNA and RNA helicase
MKELGEELKKVVRNQYRLAFRVPTREELEKMRRIHRDVSKEELAKIQRAERGLAEIVEMIRRGDISKDDLSPELRSALASLLGDGEAEEE